MNATDVILGGPTPLDVNGVLLEQLGTYLIESLTRIEAKVGSNPPADE